MRTVWRALSLSRPSMGGSADIPTILLRVLAGDEAGAALVGEPGPAPVDEHQQLVAERHEVEEVDEEPREPGGEARELQAEGRRDGAGAADRRHRPLVLVDEGLGRLPAREPQEV